MQMDKPKLSKLALAALGVVCLVSMAAGINIVGTTVNAINGYQLNGVAVPGDALCGNVGGTLYNTPCPAGGSGTQVSVSGGSMLGTLNLSSTTPAATSGNQNCSWQITGANASCQIPVGFYNTIDLAGTAQTQRLALNFSGGLFAATDSASPSRTSISLVTAAGGSGAAEVATYPSGGPGSSTAPALFDGNGNLVPTAPNNQWYSFSFGLCDPSASSNIAHCTGSQSLPSGPSYSDTAYQLVCTANVTNGANGFVTIESKTSASFNYDFGIMMVNGSSDQAGSTADCHLHHN